MKIAKDPDIYGQAAKAGLFIPFEEFQYCPNLLKAMKQRVLRELTNAEKKYDNFKGLHESGEATSRQCSSMFKYEEKIIILHKMLETIGNSMSILSKEGGKV